MWTVFRAGEDEAGPSALVMRELLKEEPAFNLLLQTGQVRRLAAQAGRRLGVGGIAFRRLRRASGTWCVGYRLGG